MTIAFSIEEHNRGAESNRVPHDVYAIEEGVSDVFGVLPLSSTDLLGLSLFTAGLQEAEPAPVLLPIDLFNGVSHLPIGSVQ
jgi:hypothetical protein